MSLKIVLAGFGTMGHHYTEKLAQNAGRWGVTLDGIVDTDITRFDLRRLGDSTSRTALLSQVLQTTPKFLNFRHALESIRPDIVINATDTESHIEIIRALEDYPNIAYLTEKPLVAQGSEEEEAATRLTGRFVSMNMITSFSAAATGLRRWIADQEGLRLVGIDAVWGKNRRNDTRPTPGIASDIVHPIGLAQSVFGAQSWSVAKTTGFYGHLSTDRTGQDLNCVYDYKAAFHTSAGAVYMDCSYAWDNQARRVTGFFRDEHGLYTVAELFLDEKDPQNPKNRIDFFRINTLSRNFAQVAHPYELHLSSDDKLSRYLGNSFDALIQGQEPGIAGLVGLKEQDDIGRMYGFLESAQVRKTNYPLPIRIIGRKPELAPHAPQLKTVAESSRTEIENRIQRFDEINALRYAPQPSR